MSCIYLVAPQGTPEWFQGRCGSTTASMATETRKRLNSLDERQQKYVDLVNSGIEKKEAAEQAGYKVMPRSALIERALAGEKIGEFTQAARDYAFKLAVERISGELLDDPQFDPWQSKRGRELEPDARLLYEERKGVLVDEVGLALTDDRKFGASVDGLIDDDGSLEIKCFLAPAKLAPILLENDIGDCKDQIQMGLWITGRKWCDFVLYCPALKRINRHLTIIRIDRDDDYIEELQRDLLAFEALVESYKNKLME
jgi:hypothetical protein